MLIALPPYRAPQPQARKDRQRCGNPDRSGLRFGIQLISWHLAKVHGPVTNDFGLDLFSMLARFQLPVGDGAFIQTKRHDNRGDRTAVGQHGQHQHDQPGRMLEVVAQGAGSFGKGFSAGMADILPLLVRMDVNPVACATIGLGAYYQLRAHRWEHVCGHTAQ